jgi:hypothetical protein
MADAVFAQMVATREGLLSGLATSRLPQKALVLWNSHTLSYD